MNDEQSSVDREIVDREMRDHDEETENHED